MASPFLYFAGDRLSRAELTAACLDGDLVELGDAYMPADAVETAALRAGSLARILGDTLAATHLTAAWIHGALPAPPVRHTVQRAVARRLHMVVDRHLVYRDVAVDADDLQLRGGVRVTTPARTLADLARVDDSAHARASFLLADAEPDALATAIARLESGVLPHKRAALARLHAIADRRQDDVTR
ncbi:type IV toxin-antitoxin system AbiEi family antitoxin [Microbacterium sp. M3]|uniref:Type IV toxin-antitoxin system AbiEi family antitoxin n=1 Tax=Microbacterium arthrosphaerae TaxID=792652 RepID=A0ABU4H1H9_9MICO|nr:MULTISPECIES: type IV toxin-antitoxin system AbiEi family antitoxin [Microbacterium]MDW4572534.1 type IV toxin-antitoxin system AbiEi family antitoxin [Microbacterium arthrosphaerae]MDW7606389.1 type IV toxin-antitoxin system AbiEi family antitoxin [Microbacterium sp. M3]